MVRPAALTSVGVSTGRRATIGGLGYVRAMLIDIADRPEAAADHLQAEYLLGCLTAERADLARKLTLHARTLNDLRTAGRAGAVSHHRWSIRRLETEVRAVNRMIDALHVRFPGLALRRDA